MIRGTMRRRVRNRRAELAVASGLIVVLQGCGADSPKEKPPEIVSRPPVEASNFSDPTVIDNRYFPMPPGREYVLEGTADRGGGQLPHQVIITVTDLTKVIDGIRTVVVWERDVNEGKLFETELAFFAQDDDGNLWNLGEYPEEYNEKGKFKGAPSTWISGLSKAQGGIHVPGDPQPNSPSYLTGFAPKVDFIDGARVEALNRQACAGVGCFPNVLVIDEWNMTPGDGHQLKNYAPGVGILRIDPRGGDEEESLVLKSVESLNVKKLAEVRQQALRLDKRGYEHGGKDYAQTPPIEVEGK